jgi:hypothetical protein
MESKDKQGQRKRQEEKKKAEDPSGQTPKPGQKQGSAFAMGKAAQPGGRPDQEDPFKGIEMIELNVVGEAFIRELGQIFAYQGYDPKRTFLVLKIAAGKAGISAKEFYEDMIALCTFGCSRGSRIARKKVVDRTSDEGITVLNILIKRYSIIDTIPTGADDVTIPRVQGTFPHICAKVMLSGVGRPIPANFDGDLPPGLRFAAGASLIPKWATNTMEAYREWSKEFDAVINANKAVKTTPEERLKQYEDATWNSNLFDDEMRAKLLLELRIVILDTADA